MRVWITGVNGFVGTNFVSHVRRTTSGVELVGIDVSASPGPNLDTYAAIDITDSTALIELARENPPTHVLHCAAAVFESDVERLWMINVRGTAVLIDALRLTGLENVRILSMGSAAEYANAGDHAISETSKVGPVSEYGRSKLAQNLLALSLGSTCSQEIIVARTFNLIGPGTSENLVAGAMLRKLADESLETLHVSDAYSSRDFIDIRDAVAGYWALLCEGYADSIYNVCSGKQITIEALAHKFVQNLRRASSVEIMTDEDDEARAMHFRGSNEKIRRDTAWSPKIGIDQSVVDMLQEAGL